MADEKTPLLQDSGGSHGGASGRKHGWSRRVSSCVVGTIRVFISTVTAPGYYLVACFYDDNGQFSLTMPFIRIGRQLSRKQRQKKKQAMAASGQKTKRDGDVKTYPAPASSITTDKDGQSPTGSVAVEHSRSLSSSSSSSSSASSVDADMSDESKSKRSIRIKAVNEDTLRKRRQRRGDKETGSQKPSTSTQQTPLTAENIKSPISQSSASRLTRYPRAPAPPRPLVPRRQPSYAMPNPPASNGGKKTLIIDLDETLIHSMAKGGRMSTGHMVEVKLQSPVGVGGAILGPQVPILYYVHKRPHCDEFLKKVSKWYNLIVFTASVQEYADPVIDWLELERKYFSARYYRQHCTFRNGAYIKDLSHVEPDLSKVMILDNSPMSYIFHEDNAIPIEGWISDPTDNDLIHLIPLFEGLQHLTDVRALLSLRLGEASPPS